MDEVVHVVYAVQLLNLGPSTHPGRAAFQVAVEDEMEQVSLAAPLHRNPTPLHPTPLSSIMDGMEHSPVERMGTVQLASSRPSAMAISTGQVKSKTLRRVNFIFGWPIHAWAGVDNPVLAQPPKWVRQRLGKTTPAQRSKKQVAKRATSNTKFTSRSRTRRSKPIRCYMCVYERRMENGEYNHGWDWIGCCARGEYISGGKVDAGDAGVMPEEKRGQILST